MIDWFSRGINFLVGGGNRLDQLNQRQVEQPRASAAQDVSQIGYKFGNPLSSQCNTVLANISGTVGYCALQLQKGRIIIIDNELNESMIINRKYVLAHTTNIMLKKPSYFLNGGMNGFDNIFGDGPIGDNVQPRRDGQNAGQ